MVDRLFSDFFTFGGSRKDCYCAFCRSPRKVYTKKGVNLWNLIAAGFGSLVLMYVFWQEFDPRVLFVFVVLLAAAEIFIHFRWRLNIVCKHCGFDPVLYLKNPQLASEKVKAQLDIRKNNPASLLSPPLQLPKVTREKVEMAQKAEHAMAIRKKQSSLLSKQV